MTATANKPFVIALEEHYYDPEVARAGEHGTASGRNAAMARLLDMEEMRLEEMDGAGINIQVLSHAPSI
jgi:hypothetical protein